MNSHDPVDGRKELPGSHEVSGGEEEEGSPHTHQSQVPGHTKYTMSLVEEASENGVCVCVCVCVCTCEHGIRMFLPCVR